MKHFLSLRITTLLRRPPARPPSRSAEGRRGETSLGLLANRWGRAEPQQQPEHTGGTRGTESRSDRDTDARAAATPPQSCRRAALTRQCQTATSSDRRTFRRSQTSPFLPFRARSVLSAPDR